MGAYLGVGACPGYYSMFILYTFVCLPILHAHKWTETDGDDGGTTNVAALAIGLPLGLNGPCVFICIIAGLYSCVKKCNHFLKKQTATLVPNSREALPRNNKDYDHAMISSKDLPTKECSQKDKAQMNTELEYMSGQQICSSEAETYNNEAPPSYDVAIAYPLANLN